MKKVSLPQLVTVLLLLLAVVVPVSWFKEGMIIFRGDPMMALDPVRFWLERWSLWQGKINLGAEQAVTTASLVHQFLQAIPAFFGGSDRASGIWHFSLWFVLPGLTMSLFMSRLVERFKISQWAVPVAVVYYLFNLYRIALYGDNNHFAVYATLPLLLYWVTRLFEAGAKPVRLAAGFGLSTLLAAQAGTNPPQYLMLWLPVLIYGAILTVVYRRQWKTSLLFWAFAALFTLLLNLFWIVPFAQTLLRQSGLGAGGNLNWLADLSRHTSLPRVLRLVGAWAWFDSWRGEPYAPYAAIYQQPLWQWLTLLPALLTLPVLLFRRAWTPYLVAILVIGAIGLAYSQGTHPPFGSLFTWSATHLPFFWIFRSPWYKFTNLTAFSYAVLIGLGAGYAISALTQSRFRVLAHRLAWVVLPLLIALPLLVAHPLLTGGLWLQKKDVSNLAPDLIPYPQSIRQAADWLNEQPGETGVALLPYQGAAIYRWGYAAPMDPVQYMTRRPLFYRGDKIGYIPGETPGATVAYRVFVERLYSFDPGAQQVAKLLGIEYIAQRNDIKYEFYDDVDSPEFIKDRLQAQPDLAYKRSFGQWDIYRYQAAVANPVFAAHQLLAVDAHPLDELASQLKSRSDQTSWPAIFFSRPLRQPNPVAVEAAIATVKPTSQLPHLDIQRSSTKYTVTGQAIEPFVLVLNQSYDPGWLAASPQAKLGPVMVANGYAPSWLVTPNGQFTVTIDYQPQHWVEPTALISSLTGLLLAWGLLTQFRLPFRRK